MAKRRKQPRRHRLSRGSGHGRTTPRSGTSRQRDDLVAEFAAWVDHLGLPGAVAKASDVVEVMLTYRGERPGDPFTWRAEDVEHFLLVACPERLQIDPDDTLGFLGLANLFVAFLGSSGRLGPGSDDVQVLGRRFEELMDDFVVAMSGRTDDHGVDLDLGDTFGGELDDLLIEDGALELYLERPSDDDVLAAAEASPLARQLRTLVDFVGDGRRLTKAGNLTLADARALVPELGTGEQLERTIRGRTFKVRSAGNLPGLSSVLKVGLEARYLRKQHGKLLATAAGRGLGDDPVADLDRIEQAVRAIGAASLRYEDNQYWFGRNFLDWFDDHLATTLAMVAGSHRPLPFDDLVDELFQAFDAAWVVDNPYWDDDFRRDLVADAAAALLTGLERIGLVDVRREVHTDELGITRDRPIEARRTAAGLRSLIRDLEADGVIVREPAHRDAPLADLLEALANARQAEFEGELAAWLAARSPTEVVDEVVGTLGGIDDAARRTVLLVLLDLVDLGDEGERVLRRAIDERPAGGLLRGWLVLTDREAPTALTALRPDEVVPVLARPAAFGDVDRLAELVAGVGGEPAQIALVESLWRVDDPYTALVIEALADAPMAPRVAKAARKALVQHRSFIANR